ncbi:MAG TPA: nitric-oxide reductase large subunit [Bryobacteraceae bacterium]|nr:nitric-oxide reductase large subunit [Bryobacteraceae bacterium]HOQ44606.1 nitric-oxide reductase large subunit [Bryobacteraceae bacterium]HPU73838.1 nitric-oxide reductase large subunit [Bryobacteraceae bacterium]
MKKLWVSFGIVVILSFGILGWIGTRIYQEMPPIPDRVLTTAGEEVIPSGDIGKGQNVWQSLGGMEVGSIWGHGSYIAPDWTADWLHREAVFVLNEWANNDYGKPFDQLPEEEKAKLQGRLQQMYRANNYNPADNTLRIEPVRARAFEAVLAHYTDVFMKGEPAYAIPAGTVNDPQRMRQLAAFIFWTAWASAANRPGDDVSYTHNWPHEPLVGNRPTGESVLWTGVSIIMLLAGICALVWWNVAQQKEEPLPVLPKTDPLGSWRATPSQHSTLKYFKVVAALILVQIGMGVITAHYGVEGSGFYGIPLDRWLPYSVARTWHIQMGIFWIATAWLAAGLFIGPLVSGFEPKFQRLGVNALFLALLVIVAGSLTGEWLSIKNKLSDAVSFFWGHQGYEYVDLGRAWQILLLAGLFIWLFLVIRAIRPALKNPGEQRQLLWLFLISAGAIGLFYGAGLAWGQHSHISIVEYWRWWVVHLWVEGFFEVFATVVIAFFFARLNLIRPAFAARAALLSATIFLSGGIIGTCHHLYFTGTPTVALAWGSVFSALEVVPLTLIAFGTMEDLRRGKLTAWAERYKWPIYFFVSVAFWNMVGAGLFGFMINPPIALYFMQGLNTTPVHGHAALFGVYGMLGIGLMLVCLRALVPNLRWKDNWLKFSFWAMNIGLFLMCVGSLLPVGLLQTWASVDTGYWYARSKDFLGTPLMQTLRWMRVPGDTIFALGALALVGFVFSIRPGKAKAYEPVEAPDVPAGVLQS